EVQQRLQPALADLGLVRRVGGVPRRVLEHVAQDDRRGVGGGGPPGHYRKQRGGGRRPRGALAPEPGLRGGGGEGGRLGAAAASGRLSGWCQRIEPGIAALISSSTDS